MEITYSPVKKTLQNVALLGIPVFRNINDCAF